MFRQPSELLQGCVGISSVILSIGGTWAMIGGATVRGKIAGANFSVNEKLQSVEDAYELVEETASQIRQEPSVSKFKKREINRKLETAEKRLDATESLISDDLNRFIDEDRPRHNFPAIESESDI